MLLFYLGSAQVWQSAAPILNLFSLLYKATKSLVWTLFSVAKCVPFRVDQSEKLVGSCSSEYKSLISLKTFTRQVKKIKISTWEANFWVFSARFCSHACVKPKQDQQRTPHWGGQGASDPIVGELPKCHTVSRSCSCLLDWSPMVVF